MAVLRAPFPSTACFSVGDELTFPGSESCTALGGRAEGIVYLFITDVQRNFKTTNANFGFMETLLLDTE